MSILLFGLVRKDQIFQNFSGLYVDLSNTFQNVVDLKFLTKVDQLIEISNEISDPNL